MHKIADLLFIFQLGSSFSSMRLLLGSCEDCGMITHNIMILNSTYH